MVMWYSVLCVLCVMDCYVKGCMFGEGMFGVVYEVCVEVMGECVVIKKI